MVPYIRYPLGDTLSKTFLNTEKSRTLFDSEVFPATDAPNKPFISSQSHHQPSQESYHLISPLHQDSPNLSLNQDNVSPDDLPSKTETSPESEEIIPIYVIAIVLVALFVMSSAFFYYLCRCLVRKKKRENHLASITPKVADPRMAGVRANHPIEFVVPTTILLGENPADDSVSETEHSSSSSKTLPIITNKRLRRSFSGFNINPEDLQHGLYVGVKAASEKGAFLGDLGKVGFSLSYNSLRNQMTVHLIGATDLPCHFLKTTANPCAKLVLLPDRTTKYMTKVQKNTMSPVFNESFVFCIRRDDLREKKLKISVWDYDRFSRKCLIGQVTYLVKDSGLANSSSGDSSTGDIWVDLKPDSISHSNGVGEMLFSLCYNADTANLALTVLKVKGLSMQQDKGKDLSVYAKVTLYVRRKLVRTKKTPSKKKAPCVEFESGFDVRVPSGALGEVDLLVTLCERAPGLGVRRVLGRTQVGANCLCDQGVQHWRDMLLSPKSTCAQWHVLAGT